MIHVNEEFQWPARTQEHRRKMVAGVLWTLYLDGPFEDQSGLATTQLMDACAARGLKVGDRTGYMGRAGFLGLLDELDKGSDKYRKGGFIRRLKNDKRTQLIELRVDPMRVGPSQFPPSPWPNEADFGKPPKGKQLPPPKPPKVDKPEPEPAKGDDHDGHTISLGVPAPTADDVLADLELSDEPIDVDAILREVYEDPVGTELVPVDDDVHRGEIVDLNGESGQAIDLLAQVQSMLSRVTTVISTQAVRQGSEDILAAIPQVIELTQEKAELERRLAELEGRLADRERDVAGAVATAVADKENEIQKLTGEREALARTLVAERRIRQAKE